MSPASGVPKVIRDAPSRAIVVSLPRELARYARSPLRWRSNCGVEVLRAGAETYPAMLEAIASAKESISLETYILVADRTGDRFKAALIERAGAGVTIRVIYDAVGSFGLANGWVEGLRDAGIEVIDFNPIAPWRRRFRLSHRNHRKVLVVDNVVAFTGGLNISNDYAATADGGGGWHDVHCEVTGQIVHDLARMFRRTWLRCGGTQFPPVPPASSVPSGTGTAFVRLLDNTLRRQRGTGAKKATVVQVIAMRWRGAGNAGLAWLVRKKSRNWVVSGTHAATGIASATSTHSSVPHCARAA